ncbi:hypothetical protein [Nocardia sp. NPDC003963]
MGVPEITETDYEAARIGQNAGPIDELSEHTLASWRRAHPGWDGRYWAVLNDIEFPVNVLTVSDPPGPHGQTSRDSPLGRSTVMWNVGVVPGRGFAKAELTAMESYQDDCFRATLHAVVVKGPSLLFHPPRFLDIYTVPAEGPRATALDELLDVAVAEVQRRYDAADPEVCQYFDPTSDCYTTP